MSEMITRHLITRHLAIRGRVQGVGFRNYMAFQAQQLGVCGWVRNRADGSVEAMVHGSAAAVAAIIERAQRGPRAAQVTAVVVSAGTGTYTAFEARNTE